MFQMSRGIYELYRHTLIAYYENLEMDSNSPLRVPIRPIKDKKWVNVETLIRVSYRRNGKSSGTPKYTVNLYHTKSNMMVNGREAHLFTGDHKAAVNIQNLDSIDQELRTVLLRELDKIQIQTLSPPPKPRGGGGGTLIFSYIPRLRSFFGFKILNFNIYLGVFRKINIFWV